MRCARLKELQTRRKRHGESHGVSEFLHYCRECDRLLNAVDAGSCSTTRKPTALETKREHQSRYNPGEPPHFAPAGTCAREMQFKIFKSLDSSLKLDVIFKQITAMMSTSQGNTTSHSLSAWFRQWHSHFLNFLYNYKYVVCICLGFSHV